MKPEHKKYILENIDKKSVKEISADLGLKERKVKKLLDREGVRVKRKFEFALPVPQKDSDSLKQIVAKATYSKISTILIFLGVIAIAFAVRFLYLEQIKTNPFFVPFYHGLDDYLYDIWAQSIAGGDVVGEGVFYGLPLYPYFLGAVYALFGHNVFIAKLLQLFIGALSCGLVYLIGQRVFNRVVGILAAIMLSFYSMAFFFEGFFVSTFLGIFLNCLLVLLLLSIYDRPGWFKWIGAGLLTGFSALANAAVLVFAPFVILWSFITFKTLPRAKTAVYSVIFILGIVLAIAPVTIRNYIVGKDFVPITAHSGITFYAGNNPEAAGSFAMPREIGTSVIDSKRSSELIAENVTKKQLKPSEVSKFWFDQGIAFIKNEPGKYLSLVFRKMLLFWNAHEMPDVMPLFFFKQYAPILQMPLFNFTIICPLALIGMFLCARLKKPDIMLLYMAIFSVFLSTVIYFVNSRYRLLAIPYLVIFAAVAFSWLYSKVTSRNYRSLVIPFVSLMVIAALMQPEMLRYDSAQAYNSLGIILKRKGEFPQAVEAYKKAIEMNPQYTTPYFNLGLLYGDQGKYSEAIDMLNKAVQLNPDFAKAHKHLGANYLRINNKSKALYHLKRSIEIDPNQPEVRNLINTNF